MPNIKMGGNYCRRVAKIFLQDCISHAAFRKFAEGAVPRSVETIKIVAQSPVHIARTTLPEQNCPSNLFFIETIDMGTA